MGFVVRHTVLVFACCLMQQGLVVAAAQEKLSGTAGERTVQAETTQSGAADGVVSPALTGERRPLYRLRKSDIVEVDFAYSPEFNQTVAVQPDGFVALREVPQVYAEGKTGPELEETIRRAYANILHDPEVTIVLKDFDKPYFIAAGEVGRPGKYELRSDTTVTEAVAIAGGFTGKAKHSQVLLFRRVSDDLVESHILNLKTMLRSRTLGEDVHLRPGDLLFVPQNLISKIRQYMPASSLSLYGSPTQF
jgi:polysaccharide biosynthesis/export protein